MLDASYSARNITELFFVEALVNVTDDDLPDGINALMRWYTCPCNA